MSAQNIEKLKALVEKGKWSYVLKIGVLGWGVPTAVIWSVTMQFKGSIPFIKSLLFALAIFPACGVLFGLIMWFFVKRQYKNVELQGKI